MSLSNNYFPKSRFDMQREMGMSSTEESKPLLLTLIESFKYNGMQVNTNKDHFSN